MRKTIIWLLVAAVTAGRPYSVVFGQQRATCGRDIEIETAQGCSWCVALKRFLARYGVPYREFSYGPLWNAPPSGVPVISVDGRRIVGFQEEVLREALCIR